MESDFFSAIGQDGDEGARELSRRKSALWSDLFVPRAETDIARQIFGVFQILCTFEIRQGVQTQRMYSSNIGWIAYYTRSLLILIY